MSDSIEAAAKVIDPLAFAEQGSCPPRGWEHRTPKEVARLLERRKSHALSVAKRIEEQRIPQPREVIGMRQDRFSMAEGVVTLEWPAEISAESAQDIEDWLELVKRKIKRAVNVRCTVPLPNR